MTATNRVLKFGGTSMGSADSISRVIAIVNDKKRLREGRVAAVVVSAMSGVTNRLVDIADRAGKGDVSYRKILGNMREAHAHTVRELIRAPHKTLEELDELFGQLHGVVEGVAQVGEITLASRDYIMSYGERLSAHILCDVLNERGTACEYLNTRHVVVTDEHFGSAAVNFAATDAAVHKYFSKHRKLQIVTGFIGATADGRVTTLGRGGSDYSAAIIGAALSAKVIEIWTDVSGIMTTDPRLVPQARVVPELAFEEAGELAYFGAKVLHPKTILPAMRKNIPVKVLNTFRPADAGTTIVANFRQRRRKSNTIEALSVKRPVVAIHIQSPRFYDGNGLIARIVQILDHHRTSIDVVTTSVTSVSVTIEDLKHIRGIVRELQNLGDVTIDRNRAIICAVGGGVNTADVVGRMFTVLGKHKIPVEMISQEASNVSITFVVKAGDAEKTLRLLHAEYIA